MVAVFFPVLILRHEAFRTSFIIHKGEPVQRIHDTVELNVQYLPMHQGSERVMDLINGFIRPFDLSQAPL